MRPYEYSEKHAVAHFNERVDAEKKQLGLLCSFQREKCLARDAYYDFDELSHAVRDVSSSMGLDAPLIVGKEVNSLEWMNQVMRLILRSDVVIVDITDPRQNVIYELGIACSLRDEDSVVITRMKNAPFESDEIRQLQFLLYDSYDDLKEKLIQQLHKSDYGLDKETKRVFESLHDNLSPLAMHMLKQMVDGKLGINKWHLSFGGESVNRIENTLSASELLAMKLAKYNYGRSPNRNEHTHEVTWEWALHPTKLGKRYMRSQKFLSIFFSPKKITQVSLKLKDEKELPST